MSEIHDIREWNLDLFSLKDKTALVTGGNTGLGQGYVAAFAKAGAKVFVVTENYNWDETETILKAIGAEYEFFKADLMKQEELAQVVPACVERFGRVDILVNNAGIRRGNPPEKYTDKDWRDTFAIHVDAAFYLSREASKIMIQQGGGKIINIGSVMSYRGDPDCVAYTACKHAVEGITRAFATGLGKYNIQVNAIAPGWIKTPGNPPGTEKFIPGIPAGRIGCPYDLMGLVVFLASPASDYMSGVLIPIDGGYLCMPV